MEQNPRRRGGSFHESEDASDDSHGPEPVDFSKLNMTDVSSQDVEEDENEIYGRGRSRSRSVHEYDPNSSHLVVPSVIENSCLEMQANNQKIINSRSSDRLAERTGPLHQKEVLALRKVMSSMPPIYRNIIVIMNVGA